MADDFAAPVKGILKAFDVGSKLAKRVSKSASSASVAQAQRITSASQDLFESFEGSKKAVTDVYVRHAGFGGLRFARILNEDKSISDRLKELKIDLTDHINDCQDLDDDPEAFDATSFTNLRKQAERISKACVLILDEVRSQLAQAKLQDLNNFGSHHDDNPSMARGEQNSRGNEEEKELKRLYSSDAASLAISTNVGTSESGIAGRLSQTNDGAQVTTPSVPMPHQEILSLPLATGQQRLIPKIQVDFRLSENENFLERRRQSRIAFQKEIRKSVSSVDENRASMISLDSRMTASPISNGSAVASPTAMQNPGTGSNGHGTFMRRQQSQGYNSQTTRSSTTSSLMQDAHFQVIDPKLQGQDSNVSCFGQTPPVNGNHFPSTDGSGALASTSKLSGFGRGVEDGLEPVRRPDLDNEKFFVPSEQKTYAVSASIKSIDSPMSHSSSFYKFGGFCEGARCQVRGEEAFKQVKRPSGQFNSSLQGKCVRCSYEVGWGEIEKDNRCEVSGIYGSSGIRFRQRFITKSHLKTTLADEPAFACIFCVEEHKTPEEHDATVFFSVTQLFKHLAKHPQPLPPVTGLVILYGRQDRSIVDFDIYFPSNSLKPSQYGMSEIASETVAHPAGTAIATHHPRTSRSNSIDTNGYPPLHFANGARILGIKFPPQYGGTWCTGYHDGEKGSFPSTAIVLELPPKEDILMDMQSSLVAYAKWDFKPKDAKEGGWLKFSKGDRLECIGYTFLDQWCWSGRTTKGRWGLFPAAFVDGLKDGGIGSGPGGLISSGRRESMNIIGNGSGGGLLARFGSKSGGVSFGLGKKKERSGSECASIKSQGSLRSSSNRTQPGLEVFVNGVSM